MTTLDNGIVIDESLTAVNFTPQEEVPNVWYGQTGEKTGCTIHHWGADGQNIHDVARTLASANARGVSAQFVLQEDYVYCIVNSWDSAWHAGHPVGNAHTIGIECRPEMTEGDLKTLESLIRYLETVYGSLEIYIHKNWVNTACPGRYEDRIPEIIDRINNVEIAAAPPVPVNEIAEQEEHHCCCKCLC